MPEESPFYIKIQQGTPYTQTLITRVLEDGISNHAEIRVTLAADTKRKLNYELKPLKIMNHDRF